MRFEPHDYQKHCVERIIEQPKVGLFLDMGLGKTVTTLTAINELKYYRFEISRVLVIAPKKVAEGTWTQEAGKWDHLQMLRVVPVLGSEAKRKEALRTDADIYVINRENVVWLVDYYRNAWPFDMVVVDESSSFKSHSAKRFKALTHVLPLIGRMVLLTGTPSPNSLMDLWSQIYLLDGGERLERKFTHFRTRYFDPGRRGPTGIVFNYVAKPGAEQTVLSKISDICISMKAEDYLQLPDIIYDTVPVVLSPTAMKAYRTMERELVLDLPEDEAEITATSAAALTGKLLQLSNGAVYDEDHHWTEVHDCKLEALEEMVELLKDRGKQALVFYSYQHDLVRIQKALQKYRVATLRGPEEMEAWNGHQVDVLLAHPASAAYGLNLQQGGNHVIWFGLTWNYEQYVQANARLHRQGQTEKVIVHHLVCEGTRDAAVMRALEKKDKAQDYVLESLKARIREVRNG